MKQNSYVILLTAQPDTIFERVGRDENRPVLNGRRSPEGIRELLEERRSYYEAAADITIETDKRTCPRLQWRLYRSWDSPVGWTLSTR